MKWRRISTIRSRLAWLVIASVIPAALMVAVLISYSYQRERSRLVRDSIATARALTSVLDRELAGVQAALFALATSPDLTSNDLSAFYNQAQDALPILIANNIVLISPNGRQLVNTLLAFGEPLPAGNSPQLRAITETGRPVITDLFIAPVVGRPLVAIGVPVRRGNAVVYDLTAGDCTRTPVQDIDRSASAGGMDSRNYRQHRHDCHPHEMNRFVGRKATPAFLKRLTEVAEDPSRRRRLKAFRS
jgi:hypothetical protein